MASKTITKDKHALYLASVQDPAEDIIRISKIYEELFSKKAASLREDFCGTFALSCCWVQSEPHCSAVAIDNDLSTLEYGKQRYFSNLSSSEQKRLFIQHSDARVISDQVDIIAAFNFSYCLIHERDDLVNYFQKVHSSLNKEGMVILDIFGGSESEIIETQERDIISHDYISDFTFQFQRKSFNPINRRAEYAIHFIYEDGIELKDAFTYDFRMWTIAELRDILKDAGFSKSLVYWEKYDDEGYGNGEFYASEKEENSVNWNSYIVGVR